MLKLFIALILLLLISLYLNIEFVSVIAWIGITVLVIYFLIKLILGLINLLFGGTIKEMEANEPNVPEEAFIETIKTTGEKTTEILARSEAQYKLAQSDWRKNLSNAFNNLIKTFNKWFKI